MSYTELVKQKLHRQRIRRLICMAVLAVYPLRHIWLGVELTDSAYSAGNYVNLDCLGYMWRFSTYLANLTGAALVQLPFGRTMMGLNGWCALFISAAAIVTFVVLTRYLDMPLGIAFIGELLAISLCWCPVTILYNYLTYLLFVLGSLSLFVALVREREPLLFLAGVFLGLNVMVRFPNLTEAALIVCVWYYGILRRKTWRRILRETGLCIAGFFSGFGLVLLQIHFEYGLGTYIRAITDLLNMPSDASDYSLYSMVVTVLMDYKASSRWLICMLLLVIAAMLVGTLFCSVAGVLKQLGVVAMPEEPSSEREEDRAFADFEEDRPEETEAEDTAAHELPLLLRIAGRVIFICCMLLMFRIWYSWGVFNVKYYTYESMFQWVAVFLLITILICIYEILARGLHHDRKLMALMVLVILGVTPLGSNNHLYPNMNNMFLVFPFALMLIYSSFCELRRISGLETEKLFVPLMPLKVMLVTFLVITGVSCMMFGLVFTFRDGMSGQKRNTKIEKNAILKGMVTNRELAEALESLTVYMEENTDPDQSILLYGQIPALTFYLDREPAITTSWADLRSFSLETMKYDMMNIPVDAEPVLIFSSELDAFLTEDVQRREALGVSDAQIIAYGSDEKLAMIREYMETRNYTRDFTNERFAVYRSKK